MFQRSAKAENKTLNKTYKNMKRGKNTKSNRSDNRCRGEEKEPS